MGTLIAWVLVRDDFRGKGIVNSLIDLPFALPDDRRRPDAARPLRARSPWAQRRVHAAVGRGRAAVRDAPVRRAGRAAGAARARQRDGAGRRVAGRGQLRPSSGASSCPTCRRRSSAAPGLAFARALGEFGSLVLITGNIPFETQVSSVFIFGQVESGAPEAAAAVSVALLVIALVVLLFFALALASRALRHEEPVRAALPRAGLPRPAPRASRSRWSSRTPSRTGSARPGTR